MYDHGWGAPMNRLPGSVTPDEHDAVRKIGAEFARQAGGIWLLINGRVTAHGTKTTDERVKEILHRAFGYPAPGRADRTLHVLLDSNGGSLDGAYAAARYLAAYANDFRVYVPSRAKSASTLLAIGADRTYLSAFGELGPLDAQIGNPRNPTMSVSALDYYQSVDYVRDVGFNTISVVLRQLINDTERLVPVSELLSTASTFAIGAIQPLMSTITALDFGGWGRSLRIGEKYASKLLSAKVKDGNVARADRIAFQLVYGYAHHLFPIDIEEANRIGLAVERMDQQTYYGAMRVLDACRHMSVVCFLSEQEAAKFEHLDMVLEYDGDGAPNDDQRADVVHTRGWDDEDPGPER